MNDIDNVILKGPKNRSDDVQCAPGIQHAFCGNRKGTCINDDFYLESAQQHTKEKVFQCPNPVFWSEK